MIGELALTFDDGGWHGDFSDTSVRGEVRAAVRPISQAPRNQRSTAPGKGENLLSLGHVTSATVSEATPYRPAIAGMLPATAERRAILEAEHGRLAAKQFESDGLTVAEERELRMVRWALDALDMDEMEPAIRRLQDLVALHQNLQREVDRLVAAVK